MSLLTAPAPGFWAVYEWRRHEAGRQALETRYTAAIERAIHAAIQTVQQQLHSPRALATALASARVVLTRQLRRIAQQWLPVLLRFGWTNAVEAINARLRQSRGLLTFDVKAPIELDFDLLWPEIAQYIQERPYEYAPEIVESLIQQFRGVLQTGFDEGLGIAAIARTILALELPEIARMRATRIARTELISASNRGALASYAASDVVEQKQWLATHDERTRDTHRAWEWPPERQIVDLEEPFVLPDGAQLMCPGDASLGAPLEDIINCRCTLAPVVEGLFA